MFGLIKTLLPSKNQTKTFCEENWHLDIRNENYEKKLLASKFPIEIEISEWIDKKTSKIDHDFYDICWIDPEKGREPGLFIAFMHKKLFKECFRNIGREPESLCRRKVKMKLIKHDDAKDRKSHPEWECWLEVIEAQFISWVPETEEEKNEWK